MKNAMKRFYYENEKRNEKILKKMFGCKNLCEGIKLEESVKSELEKTLHKEIDLIGFPEVKGNGYLMYLYCKYKTLRTILDLYNDNRKLYAFGNDYLEAKND